MSAPTQVWGAPQPEQPKPKRARRWQWIVGIVVALLVGVGIGQGDPETTPVASGTDATPAPTKTVTVEVEVPGPTKTVEVEVPGATKTVTVKPKPKAPAAPKVPTIEGDGVYLVGSEVKPGTYRSRPAAGGIGMCYAARLNSLEGGLGDIIDNQVSEGQVVITIAASDKAFETTGCDTWQRVG